MKSSITRNIRYLLCIGLMAFVSQSCKKDGNPNGLPGVSPDTYAGTIDGYTSSDEIFPQNLIAYWGFEDTKNETISGTAPTQTAGDVFVTGGVRGKAISLTAGYLYYGSQLPKFRTDSIKSWSISMWVKLLNNGSKRTMVFQLARPGIFNGNINFALNTNSYPATNDSTLTINPTFSTINSLTGGSLQDNLNNVLNRIRLNKWTHLVLTYDITTGVFNNWADGIKVGNFPNRGTTNLFKSWEPNEIIIGSNYNGIPGKAVNTDVAFAPMTGQIDEIRFFNRALPDAHIKALNNLGKANK